MKLRWNNTIALATYLIIGIGGAIIFRTCSERDNRLPIGKTIHIMPMNVPPANDPAQRREP